MNEPFEYVKKRLNSLYKDAIEAEKQEGFGLEHSAEVIMDELKQLMNFVNKNLEGEPLSSLNLTRSNRTLGDRGFMTYVKTNIRKMADLLDIEFDLDRPDEKPQNVFNVIQKQNVSQYSSQTFSSIISNINQLDMDIEIKKEVIGLVNSFKDEAEKTDPDVGKLLDFWKKIKNKSVEAAAMISYYATVIGVFDKIMERLGS